MAKVDDIYDAIKAKYDFSIPGEYRAMEAAGWFKIRRPGKRFDPDREPNYLWIPEMEWLRPREILDYEPGKYHKPGFVPFAFNGAGDHWCWWPSQDPQAVVLCPHDCEMGVFDAPSFVGSIYRQCLEYATGLDRTEEALVRQRFTDWAERLSEYFEPSWTKRLQALAKAALIEGGFAETRPVSPSEVADACRGMLPRLKERLSSKDFASFSSEMEKLLSSPELSIIASQQASAMKNFARLLTDEQCDALVKRDLKFPRLDKEFKWMKI